MTTGILQMTAWFLPLFLEEMFEYFQIIIVPKNFQESLKTHSIIRYLRVTGFAVTHILMGWVHECPTMVSSDSTVITAGTLRDKALILTLCP